MNDSLKSLQCPTAGAARVRGFPWKRRIFSISFSWQMRWNKLHVFWCIRSLWYFIFNVSFLLFLFWHFIDVQVLNLAFLELTLQIETQKFWSTCPPFSSVSASLVRRPLLSGFAFWQNKRNKHTCQNSLAKITFCPLFNIDTTMKNAPSKSI